MSLMCEVFIFSTFNDGNGDKNPRTGASLSLNPHEGVRPYGAVINYKGQEVRPLQTPVISSKANDAQNQEETEVIQVPDTDNMIGPAVGPGICRLYVFLMRLLKLQHQNKLHPLQLVQTL
ncbi:hypothetical protein NPIL_369571 [Nephila pilipes]|uniref:Uncharacterized protein n=1 Tax=Nephila pilipes TaxID=299642 RepID=A0A8X6R076_NEPPI|nr:hypothetical protein NPIL_369571 [Nephila pilipes]